MADLPLRDDDPFLPALHATIDRNFPEFKPLEDPPAHLSTPILFHDRHLAQQLTLKRVKIIPCLAESLASYGITCLQTFVKNGFRFDRSTYVSHDLCETRQPMKGAYSVGAGYCDIFADAITQLSTKILLTPTLPEWTLTLVFVPGDPTFSPGKEAFADGRLIINRREPTLQLPGAAGKTALELHDLFPWLASWSFYPLNKRGRKLVSRMSSMSPFLWETAHTTHPPSMGHVPVPPDAERGFTYQKISSYVSGRRKGAKETETTVSSYKKGVVKVPKSKATRKYAPAPKDFIQKAWCTAVREDTTFLIFNCGTHERIGIRHRRSQSLYLSGLIDTAHTRPAYGRIQLGLYLAIIQNALDRKDARKDFDSVHQAGLKRPHGDLDLDVDVDLPAPKRQKFDEPRRTMTLANSLEGYSVTKAEKEICIREILLVNLSYGNYQSPLPSSFTRVGTSCVRGLYNDDFKPPARRSTYNPAQYMTVTLRRPIGKGAIGTTHRGVIEVISQSGEILTHPCLVKLAFGIEAQSALENEFSIYRHLARSDVYSGIMRVHGLFHDTQTDTSALLMDYGGYSLRRREYERDNKFDQNYVELDQSDRVVITKALELIHSAGVCHNDIRIDNIVLNNANEVAIIDFDRASFATRDIEYEADLATLRTTVRLADTSTAYTSSDDSEAASPEQ